MLTILMNLHSMSQDDKITRHNKTYEKKNKAHGITWMIYDWMAFGWIRFNRIIHYEFALEIHIKVEFMRKG